MIHQEGHFRNLIFLATLLYTFIILNGKLAASYIKPVLPHFPAHGINIINHALHIYCAGFAIGLFQLKRWVHINSPL